MVADMTADAAGLNPEDRIQPGEIFLEVDRGSRGRRPKTRPPSLRA